MKRKKQSYHYFQIIWFAYFKKKDNQVSQKYATGNKLKWHDQIKMNKQNPMAPVPSKWLKLDWVYQVSPKTEQLRFLWITDRIIKWHSLEIIWQILLSQTYIAKQFIHPVLRYYPRTHENMSIQILPHECT